MADNHIDPKSGYCSRTKTFHSLRPPAPLPPPSQPLSIIDYTFTLLLSTPTFSPTTTVFLIDASSGRHIYFSEFISQTQSLASSLQSLFPSLSTNQVALILSPSSLHVPILYFALLSLGVTVSPVNPLSTDSELTHLINMSNPDVAFTTSSFAHKVPKLPLGTILLDSPQFLSMLTSKFPRANNYNSRTVSQSGTAAILYSSGTTGRVKGVELTHRNFIAIIGDGHHSRSLKLQEEGEEATSRTQAVSLFMLPLFHVFGFFMLIRAAALGDTLVLMERFDFEKVLQAVGKYRVTYMPVSPPLVVAMAKSDLVDKYDLSSLDLFGCGGAPLGKEIAEEFSAKFPNVVIAQGFGMTESAGGTTGMLTPNECEKYGSAGRLSSITEAKIVDPATGEALPPLQRGELWLRGPMIMKGYVGDKEATALTLTSEGWLKTGDLCYFDSDGFLYVVDRLKELIKYKAYQVPPAELEHLLQSNPEIADAAVIPYPDEAAGQIPMAYVVRKPGSIINEAQVMEYIAKLVSPYKKIRRVAFISSIPKSPAGKVLRRELVNHALSGPSARL